MTCSMLSASIAEAVPKKYHRNPGWRNAAKEVGAGGGAPRESIAVFNSLFVQTRASGRPLCQRAPVVVFASRGQCFHEAVTQDTGEWHGHILRVRGRQCQPDVLDGKGIRKARGL